MTVYDLMHLLAILVLGEKGINRYTWKMPPVNGRPWAECCTENLRMHSICPFVRKQPGCADSLPGLGSGMNTWALV